MLKNLQKVLDEAHEGHKYIRDIDQYNKREHWELGLKGDCEDFALWCRKRLLDLYNIESDLIYCKTETGVGHLVISVDGWILDNRHKWVTSRDKLPYTWLKIGKPDGTWYKIKS